MKKNYFILFLILSSAIFAHKNDSIVNELNKKIKLSKNNIEKTILLDSIIKYEFSNVDRTEVFNKNETLLQLLNLSNDSLILISAYRTKGLIYKEWGNLDSSLIYLGKGLAIAKTKDSIEYGYLLTDMASIYAKHNLDSALHINLRALQYFKKINFLAGEYFAGMRVGYNYQILGKHNIAATYFYEILNDSSDRDYERTFSMIHNQLSFSLAAVENYEKAAFHIMQAIKINKKLQEFPLLASNNYALGNIYNKVKKYDSAILYLNKSLSYYNKINYIPMITNCNNAIGIMYYEKLEYKRAIPYLKKSFSLSKELNDFNVSLLACTSLASIYTSNKEYDKAKFYLKKAINISDNYKSELAKKELYQSSYKLYEKTGEYKKAFSYLQLYKNITDSITGIEKSSIIAELEAKYETEKKDKEIKEIAKQNKIKDLEIQNTNLALKQQNYWLIGIIIGTILLIGLVILFYSKKRLRLEYKTSQVEQKLLRTQMNPHFMSNTLASIQTYLFEGNTIEAGKYLSKFGKLNRQILDFSRKESITLGEEIELLTNYMDLQLFLTDNKFTYSITIDKSLDLDDITLPPMLAQPILENAIKHGITPKDKKGNIEINFKEKNNILTLQIIDNGIGYDLSTSYKSHESHSSSITKERLDLFNAKVNKKITYTVKNLRDNNLTSGTFVAFNIPI